MSEHEVWRYGYTSPAGTYYEVSSQGNCRRWLKGRQVWRVAGRSKTTDGYYYIHGDSKGVNWCKKIHRLVANAFLPNWLDLPQVDHRNGDTLDNRIINLRWETHAGNMRNKVGKGYSWHKQHKKWNAQLQVNGKCRSLGLFDTTDEARAAYVAAKRRLHPESIARLPS